MSLSRFEAFLKTVMGLDTASVGSTTIERAVRERVASSRVGNLDAYWEWLNSSLDELQALIEAVVVPETWFFRDPGAFDALSAVVRHGALPVATEPLRLLSVPSSTGEEPSRWPWPCSTRVCPRPASRWTPWTAACAG